MNINNRQDSLINTISLKNRILLLSMLLTMILVCVFGWFELVRWKRLGRNYIESKGSTLIRTISPLFFDYLKSGNTDKIIKLAESLTTKDVENNDIISVKIFDSNKSKIAESTLSVENRQIDYWYFPPTIVIEKPIIDTEKSKEIGYVQVVFSNEYFATKSLEVINISILCLIIGLFFSLYLSKIIVKYVNKPISKLSNIISKTTDNFTNLDLDIENSREILQLEFTMSDFLTKTDEKIKNLLSKNNEQEKKIFETTALMNINHSLDVTNKTDDIYIKLVENVLSVLNGIQLCTVLIVDEFHNEFEYKVVKGLNPGSIVQNKRIPIESSLALKVYQTGESLIVNETSIKTLGNTESSSSDTSKTDKYFYFPIIVKGKVTAILYGKNKISGENFSESDLRLVEGIIKETSIALRNAMLWQELNYKILELNNLHEIAKNIGTVLDINKLLELILDHTDQIFGGVATSSIILYDEETRLLNVKLYKGKQSNKGMKPIKCGEGIAGKVFQRGEPIMINDMHTIEKENSESVDNGSSSICVPLKIKEKCLGVLSITDKLSGEPFNKSDLDMMVTLASQIAVSLNNAKLYEDLETSYLSAVRALANSIDAKDAYTRGHSERVAKYSYEIGLKMNLSEDELKTLYIGALLHDIGKIGIPESIINKTDRLTNEEYREIKTHPCRGAMIIEPAKFLKEKVPLIKYHHERYDGKGYPDGLKGEEIPLLARIICCADSFDAMTSKRAYRDIMPLEEARKEIIRCSETQFDPKVVNAFLDVVADEEKINEIRNLK